MLSKNITYLILLNRSFSVRYTIKIPISEFKEIIRKNILPDKNPSIFKRHSQVFQGRFSGLKGRRLNLQKINKIRFGSAQGPGLKIKGYIEPISENEFIFNVKFKSISFYLIWIPTIIFFCIALISLIYSTIINESEFPFSFIIGFWSTLMIIGLITSSVSIKTAKSDFFNFENCFYSELKGANKIERNTLPNTN